MGNDDETDADVEDDTDDDGKSPTDKGNENVGDEGEVGVDEAAVNKKTTRNPAQITRNHLIS